MKILLIHSDFISYEPKKKAIKDAEAAKKGPVKVKEALVVFSSVEKRDESNQKKIIENTVKEILDVRKQVKAKNVVLYPFVHLSSSPSSPASALNALKGIENQLKKKKVVVNRAPFGWYKGFDVKCKGHPLSELSRDITAEGRADKVGVSKALEKERELKSEWFVADPKGKMHKITMGDGKIKGFDFGHHPKLEKLVNYEMAKSRLVKVEPPHIKMMRRLELVDYEEGSDPGHFRYFPKGKLVKSLMEEWVTNKMLDYGAMEVETPVMYDSEHPALKDYLSRFPARQYTIQSPNKSCFLRFSACFGQFLMSHDASISYRNLPMKLYEMTRYSFRVEQRGELAGLRRLRGFTMPDCHALCRDIKQAKEEMLVRFGVSLDVMEGFGLGSDNLELSIRTVKDFHEQNPEHLIKIVKKWGKPALVEMWDKRFFYFVFKHEWNFVDALDKAACLTTDQIDVENAERYDILFTDKDNKRKRPVILHLSPSGSIERVIYAVLEKAYMEQQKGKNPVFPLWMAPTQVRLCPVSDKFLPWSAKIADQLEKESIRVDIDDRVESVQKKIRDAETEWVNLIVVIGDKEKKSGRLAVRFRETGKVEPMKAGGILNLIKNDTKGFPYRPLPLPRMLTKRVVFLG
jgi:threonyl-tRNA synthetase